MRHHNDITPTSLFLFHLNRENGPISKDSMQPKYTPIAVVPDTRLMDSGCVPLDKDRKDFLGQSQTKEIIEDNPTLLDRSEL